MLCFLLQEKVELWIIGDKPDLLSFANQLESFFTGQKVSMLDVLAVGDPTLIIPDSDKSTIPFEKITFHLDDKGKGCFFHDMQTKTITSSGALKHIKELQSALTFVANSENPFEHDHLPLLDLYCLDGPEPPYPENLFQEVTIYANRGKMDGP